MRFRVKSREAMRELSKELSKVGIMNRTEERLEKDVEIYVVLRGSIKDIEREADEKGYPDIATLLNGAIGHYELLQIGEEVKLPEDEAVFETLRENGLLDENNRLTKKPPASRITWVLPVPIELVDPDDFEDSEMLTRVVFRMAHYVEVLEVDGELVERALEIAEGYVDEDELEEATLVGLAESVLAETVMESLREDNRKDALIARVMESVPIRLEDEDELRVEIDEESLEEFLKHLQRLGYLKVKGNKIWW